MRNLIFLSFLICLTGCVKSNPDQIQIVKGDPASQLALWKKKGISNYEMTMKISCYCLQGRVGPHLIVVENDKIKTVNNLPYDSTKTGPILTINELFDLVVTSSPIQSSGSMPTSRGARATGSENALKDWVFEFWKRFLKTQRGRNKT